jgi:hypothetical protein
MTLFFLHLCGARVPLSAPAAEHKISEGGQEWYPVPGGRTNIFVEAAHLLHAVTVAISSPARITVSYRVEDVIKNTNLALMRAYKSVLDSMLEPQSKIAYQNEVVRVPCRAVLCCAWTSLADCRLSCPEIGQAALFTIHPRHLLLPVQRRLLSIYLYSLDSSADPDRPVFQNFFDKLQGKPVAPKEPRIKSDNPAVKQPLRNWD